MERWKTGRWNVGGENEVAKAASRPTCRRSLSSGVPTLSGVFDRYSVTTLDSIGDSQFRSVTRSVTDRCIRYKKRWKSDCGSAGSFLTSRWLSSRPVTTTTRSPGVGWHGSFGISLLRHQQRIMIRHQLPSMLPLDPYSGEAVVTGNSFASVLANHG
jgi:hypothetical protein